jgi:four helix bundle protein
MQTLAFAGDQIASLGGAVLVERESPARFDTRKHTDQTLADSVFFHDLACDFLLGDLGGEQVLEGSAVLVGNGLGVLLQATGNLLCKRGKLGQAHPLAPEPLLNAFAVADGSQSSAEENSIKTGYNAFEAALVSLQKTLHAFLPDEFVQTHHKEKSMERPCFRLPEAIGMRDFRTMKVWGKAHQLTLRAYQATSGFPRAELYGLTSQVRNASSSIPSNIAEGCGRSSEGEFAHFLNISMGSASELEYRVLLSRDLHYLNNADYEELEARITEVKRMLASLIRTLIADR